MKIFWVYASCLSPASFGKGHLNPSAKNQIVQLVYGSGPRLSISSLPSYRRCWTRTCLSGHLLLIYTDLELGVYQILKELRGRTIWGFVSRQVLLLQFYVWIRIIPAVHRCSRVQWSERGDLMMLVLVFPWYSLFCLGSCCPWSWAGHWCHHWGHLPLQRVICCFFLEVVWGLGAQLFGTSWKSPLPPTHCFHVACTSKHQRRDDL